MTTQIKAGVIAANAITASELASSALSGGSFTGDVTFDSGTLYVDSTNNRVGIGETNPSRQFQISGTTGTTLYLKNSSSSVYLQLGSNSYDNDNSSYIGSETNKSMSFWTVNQRRMTIDASGKVGVGNTSPLGKLTISNAAGTNAPETITAANTYLQLGSGDYGLNGNGKFMIGFGYTDATNTNSPAYIGFEEETSSGDTAGQLTFYTRGVTTDTAPTQRMVIGGTGKVQIWHGGTTYYTSFEGNNEINTYTAAGANSTMYIQHNGGDLDIGAGTFRLDRSNNRIKIRRSTYNSGNIPFFISNGTEGPGASYDTVVVSQDDVPCIRLDETASGQELTLAVGNENSNNAVIGSTGKITLATNRLSGELGWANNNAMVVVDTSQVLINTDLNAPGVVVQTVRAGNQNATGTGNFDIVSVSITPKFANSDMIIHAYLQWSVLTNNADDWGIVLQRDGTDILGESENNYFISGGGVDAYDWIGQGSNVYGVNFASKTDIDTGRSSSTSAITYKLRRSARDGTSKNVIFGIDGWGGGGSESQRSICTLVVQEVLPN